MFSIAYSKIVIFYVGVAGTGVQMEFLPHRGSLASSHFGRKQNVGQSGRMQVGGGGRL